MFKIVLYLYLGLVFSLSAEERNNKSLEIKDEKGAQYAVFKYGMLQPENLKNSGELAYHKKRNQFDFRLIIDGYHNRLLILTLKKKSKQLQVKLLSRTGKKLHLTGEFELSDFYYTSIKSLYTSKKFTSLSQLSYTERIASQTLGGNLCTLEYTKNGEYHVIDWANPSYLIEKNVFGNQRVEEIKKYRELVDLLLYCSSMRALSNT